jgi:hypothetical protein
VEVAVRDLAFDDRGAAMGQVTNKPSGATRSRPVPRKRKGQNRN